MSDMAAKGQETEKLDMRKILPIFVIVLIDLLGVTIILPLLPLYATKFGADPFVVGLLAATYPLMQFIGAPFLGRLSDQYGRRPVLIVSQIGTLLGFLLLGFATTLWMLFLSRIIDGLSGANISAAQAAISDSTTENNRTQGLGLIGAAFGLGFIIGPVIAFGALAASGNDYRVPAFVAAAFSLISILLTTFWFKETLPAEKRGQHHSEHSSLQAVFRALRLPVTGTLLVLVFAQQLAFGGLENFFSLFSLSQLGLNASANSILFVWIGLILVIVQGGLVGQWSRRFGERKLIYAGLLLMTVGFVLTALTPAIPPPWYNQQAVMSELSNGTTTGTVVQNLPPDSPTGWLGVVWLMVAMVPVSVGSGILSPSINSLLTKRVAATQVGGILGISTAMLSAANIFAPVIGGFLFQFGSAVLPFWCGAIMLGILFWYALGAIKPEGKERELQQVGV